MRAIRDEDFDATNRVDDNPKEGQVIVLATDLEFDENADPEQGQDFVAKVALRDGQYVLLSVNGLPVISDTVSESLEEDEEAYLEDEGDVDSEEEDEDDMEKEKPKNSSNKLKM